MGKSVIATVQSNRTRTSGLANRQGKRELTGSDDPSTEGSEAP